MKDAATAAPEIHLERLEYLERRFSTRVVEGEDAELLLELQFETLWGELGRVASMKSDQVPYNIEPDHAQVLARVGVYGTSRLTDALDRWFLLRWFQDKTGPGADGPQGRWKRLAQLAIKDAHADIASLVDAILLFAVNLQSIECPDPRGRVPSFGEFQRSGSKWRKSLSPAAEALLDQMGEWYGFVKNIRDSLTHRQHVGHIFLHPNGELAFQVYLESDEPEITAEPLLVRPAGGPVVQFSLYELWMLAEATFFMDSLAGVACEAFGIQDSDLPRGGRFGGAEELLSELQRLVVRCKEQQP